MNSLRESLPNLGRKGYATSTTPALLSRCSRPYHRVRGKAHRNFTCVTLRHDQSVYQRAREWGGPFGRSCTTAPTILGHSVHTCQPQVLVDRNHMRGALGLQVPVVVIQSAYIQSGTVASREGQSCLVSASITNGCPTWPIQVTRQKAIYCALRQTA